MFDAKTAIASLVIGGQVRMNAGQPVGTPVTITYAFQDHLPAVVDRVSFGDIGATFEPFNDAMREGTRALLHYVEQVAGVTFVEVADSDPNAMIRFSGTSLPPTPGICTYGFAYFPNLDANGHEIGAAGQIWLNFARTLNIRGQDFAHQSETLLHEIGHVLGLKHANQGDSPLPFSEWGGGYSIMNEGVRGPAAWTETNTGNGNGPVGHWWTEDYQIKDTYSPYDILALRYLYGPSLHPDLSNNSYKFDDQPVWTTILDNGGTDTIDTSAATFPSVIDLHDGAFSSIAVRTLQQYAAHLQSWVGGIQDNYFLDRFTSTYADVLYSGADNVSIAPGSVIENAIGGAGNDRITGNDVANNLRGMDGNDMLEGDGGDDTLDGGNGTDIAIFRGASSAYTIRVNADGTVTVSGGSDGTDTLRNVELLQFADKVMTALHGDDAAVARLYSAAFGRTPDAGGLAVQLDALHHGATPTQLASNFIASAEFQSRYGSSVSDAAFVNALYSNVLGRPADPAGLAVQMNALLSDKVTRADLLLNFANSSENQSKATSDWLVLI